MKKTRKSNSARKSRGGSNSSFFSGPSSAVKEKAPLKEKTFFSGNRAKNASMGRPGKTYTAGGKKDRFIRPPNDPGSQIREEDVEVIEDYSVEDSGEVAQQALQSTGRGCCSSITGFFWLIGISCLVVVIILAVKCGGC